MLFAINTHAEELNPANIIIRNFSPEIYHAHQQNWSITQDHRGIMYIGNTDGLLEFDGAEWRLITLPNHSGVYSFAKDDVGRIYVGGDGEMGFLSPDTSGTLRYISLMRQIPEDYRMLADRIFKIHSTPQGIFFSSERAIFLFKQDTVEVFNTSDHFFTTMYINDTFYALDGDNGLMYYRDGILWPMHGSELIRAYIVLPIEAGQALVVTPYAGILRLNPNNVDSVNYIEPTYNCFSPWPTKIDDFFKSNKILCGTILSNNWIVLGTEEQGIIIIDSNGEKVGQINKETGLNTNTIYEVYQDGQGNIWASLDNGIAVINLNQTTPYFQPQLSDSNYASKFVAYVRRVDDTKTETSFFGGAYFTNTLGPILLRQAQKMKPEFTHKSNAFRFKYAANWYSESDSLLYQYYLEGLDEAWSVWTPRTEKEFTNLYWGKYTFHVRAQNALGEISNAASYTFSIVPPWFETWWYYTLQVVLLVSFLITSSFLNRAGKGAKFSNFLTNTVVVVIFKYINMAIAPLIGSATAGVALFKIIMSIFMGYIMNPAQALFAKYAFKLTAKQAEKEAAPVIETEPEKEIVEQSYIDEAMSRGRAKR